MINNIKLLFIGNCIVYTNKDCMPKVQLSDHTVWLSSDVMWKTWDWFGCFWGQVRDQSGSGSS